MVNDAEAVLQAVRVGVGRSLLPRFVADGDPGLIRVGDSAPVLSRDLLLLIHPDLRPQARIAAVVAWLESTVARLGTAAATDLN